MMYKDHDLKVLSWNLVILLNETHIMLGREKVWRNANLREWWLQLLFIAVEQKQGILIITLLVVILSSKANIVSCII